MKTREEWIEEVEHALDNVHDMDVTMKGYAASVVDDVLLPALREAKNAALEEAWEAVMGHFWSRDVEWWLHATKKEVSVVAAHECAAAIRSLKDQTP